MYSKRSHFLYIKVFSHNCVSQWHVIFIYIHLSETHTWYSCIVVGISQGIGGETVLSESLAVHIHGVLDFLMTLKEKVLMPDLEYRPYHMLFQYSQYSPMKDKRVFKKQIHHCS